MYNERTRASTASYDVPVKRIHAYLLVSSQLLSGVATYNYLGSYFF